MAEITSTTLIPYTGLYQDLGVVYIKSHQSDVCVRLCGLLCGLCGFYVDLDPKFNCLLKPDLLVA